MSASRGPALLAVTGAAGFVGMHLVRGFEARGARVLPLVRTVTDRSPAGSQVLDEVLANDAAGLRGVDVVVHAAAVRHRYGVDAATYRASNVDLVERTLRATGYGPLRGIAVTVHARLVILSGRVPSYYLKQVAQTTALAIPGTRHLRNDVDVVRPRPLYTGALAQGVAVEE